ncbi:hypothetical protein PPERSA_11694 [Pseudocohnilembus persalinus]|uniref:RRM domain-containing protein n=1 Tax=Pseudocohnilembus persalinus TaxID=266149 RepID=A0A0V0R109_PSEPJ|nr:hypothetical protein PPERSA_11694 [Pseudocohnilembus persalinus]|eukprot:KRX08217.1 hypothetical protein PPERSA_11694 [Pseudocohnilembus persalinus]
MGYDNKPSNKLFVGNLSSKTKEEDLSKLFEAYGTIREIKLKNKTGSNFFGFVEFEKVEDAEEALNKLNFAECLGKDIRIEFGKGGRRGTYDSRDSRGGYRGSELKRCYNCGSTSHKVADCRRSRSYSPRRSRRSRYSRSRSRSSSRHKSRRSRRSRSRSSSRDKRKHKRRSHRSRSRDRKRSYSGRRDRSRSNRRSRRSPSTDSGRSRNRSISRSRSNKSRSKSSN